MTNEQRTKAVVRAYYEAWPAGGATPNEGRLREILAPSLVFEGMATQHGVDAFLPGLINVAKVIEERTVERELFVGGDAVVFYTMKLKQPEGTFRFAELFEIANDRITSIKLVFDMTEFKKLRAG